MAITNNHVSAHRRAVNTRKATYNKELNDIMNKYYIELHKMYVHTEKEEELFNDTFLRLTRIYTSDQDIFELFKYWFNSLKVEYWRNDRLCNIHTSNIDDKFDLIVDDSISEKVFKDYILNTAITLNEYRNNQATIIKKINEVSHEAVKNLNRLFKEYQIIK